MKRNLDQLANYEHDLLIIGGGIYGATIAWDAVLKGLSVALIERGDFGEATSANSLKIVHGGLRYLQTLDVERMRESIRERRVLLNIAPHLVHPLQCVMPTYGHLMKGKEVMFAGVLMNDIISFDRNRYVDPEKSIPRGRIISKKECLQLVPGIDGKRVTGGVLWTDAQMYNSERLTLAFILSAVREGAVVANYAEANGFLKRSEGIRGVTAIDKLTGNHLDIRAKCVVNATGAWVDELLNGTVQNNERVNLSTAMNLVIRRNMLKECAAGISGKFENTTHDGTVYHGSRVLFMTPWREFTIIGTFHRPFHDKPDKMKVTEAEIEEFLKEINSALIEDPINREEVTFFHKGFLAMDGIHPKTGEVMLTKHYKIRDHSKEDGLDGIISVVGVKYTTARDVAEKTVNLVFKKLGRKSPKCSSHEIALVGGRIQGFDDFLSQAYAQLPKDLDDSVIRHLVYNYGSQYPRILAEGEKDPNGLKTISGSTEVLRTEILHCIREEMARKLSDVVLRRTDLGSGGHPGEESLKSVASIMARELGWDKTRLRNELAEMNAFYVPAD